MSIVKLRIFWDILISCYSSMQIAQVHRATLRSGEDVVVKVQHEGIKTVILEVLHAFGF